jgi:hypothetical protein
MARRFRLLGEPLIAEAGAAGQVWVAGPGMVQHVPMPADFVELLAAERLSEADLAMAVRGSGPEAARARDRRIGRRLKEQAGAAGRGVLLDATTAWGVFSGLIGLGQPAPGPFNVLDLSTLTFACLFYDQVFFLPGAEAAWLAEDLLPGVCEMLQVPGLAADASALQYLGDPASDLLAASTWRRQFESDWEIFLNGQVRLSSDELQAWQTGFDPFWDNVAISDVMSARLDFGGVPVTSRDDDPDLTMATLRPLRTAAVAAALDVPYVASPVFSVPYRRIAPMLGTQARAIDILLGKVTPVTDAQTARLPELLPCAAPLPFGLVLSTMRTPDDFAPALLSWRERFAPLRAQLYADLVVEGQSETAVARRYANGLESLRAGRGVSTAVPAVSSALGSAAAAAPILLGGGSAIAAGGAAIAGYLAGLAVIPGLSERLTRLTARANRRHLLPLIALRDHAAAVRDLADDVGRVWGHRWGPGYVPPGGGAGRLDEIKIIDHLVRQPMPPPFLMTPF